MSATTVEEARPQVRERWAWLLFPGGLIAFGIALLTLLAGLSGLVAAVGAAGDDGSTLTVSLHSGGELQARPGQHFYGGGPHVADGTSVEVTGVTASVTGLDAATRFAVLAGPAAWASTASVTATGIGVALMRLRRRTGRSAATPVLVAATGLAVGSTVAQLLGGYVNVHLEQVAWIGTAGFDGFSGNSGTVFDLTPLGAAAGLLVVVLLIRRGDRATQPELKDVPA